MASSTYKQKHNCQRKPFSWKTRSVKKSPFRRLNTAKKAEQDYWKRRSIGFTARSSLKAMGRIPRSDGCYLLGPKYKK